jgi:YVTN family beta-propeller protein
MKKQIIYLLPFLVTLIVLGSSCNKHDKHEDHTMLNIDYPAAYVVNGQSNSLSVINLSDNSVSETICLNGATFPHHISINPAKTKLAIAITSTDLSGGHAGHSEATEGLKVQIVNAKTGMIEKEIPLAKMPHNAIFNNDGTELWIGQSDDIQSQVLVYKTTDWSLQNTINVGKGVSEITFSENGSLSFACNTTDGTVSVINANTKSIEATVTVGTDPIGAWSASNGNMYVDNETSQTISEISVSGLNVISTINLGFKPGYVAYNSTNSELWVTDATNGKIVYYTLISGSWSQLGTIISGPDAHAIVFNNDQSKAYVTNQGDGSVSVIDVTTHSVIKKITVGSKPNGIVLKE